MDNGVPQFITSNPAVDEFNRANQVAQQQDTQALQQQKAGTDLAIATATAPTKLRAMNAEADLATANAGKAQAELPYAGPLAAAHVNQANASTRASLAAAKNSEMAGFYKSLDYLNSGDVESAKAVAAQTGHPLPDVVIQNSQLRQTVTAIAKRAQELYPNRPANQQAYIKAQMDELHQQAQQGQRPNPVEQPYTMPPGAPAPADYGGPKNGGGEVERIASQLQEEYRLKNPGKELSYADAVDRARRGARTEENTLARERLANQAARSENPDMSTLEKWRGTYGLPTKVPQGQGTKEAPFQATTQDHVDWFKANAPAGSVISVNGQLLTK